MLVLIIDDEKNILDLLIDYAEDEDFEVIALDDPSNIAGVGQVIQEHRPGLVITDYRMTHTDGRQIVELCHQLGTKVILHTSNSRSEFDDISSLLAGFIQKPASLDIYDEVIKKALE